MIAFMEVWTIGEALFVVLDRVDFVFMEAQLCIHTSCVFLFGCALQLVLESTIIHEGEFIGSERR